MQVQLMSGVSIVKVENGYIVSFLDYGMGQGKAHVFVDKSAALAFMAEQVDRPIDHEGLYAPFPRPRSVAVG